MILQFLIPFLYPTSSHHSNSRKGMQITVDSNFLSTCLALPLLWSHLANQHTIRLCQRRIGFHHSSMFLHLSTFRPAKHIQNGCRAVNLQVEVPKVWTASVLASVQEQTSVGACKAKRQHLSEQLHCVSHRDLSIRLF